MSLLNMNLEEIISKLKEAFTQDEVKSRVLNQEWRARNQDNGIDSTGFCYAASEVIYRLDGGKQNWKKVSISEQDWNLGGHCYLINKQTNEILDITSDQYGNIIIPYELGRAGGFRQVSGKARILSILAGLGEIE